MSKNKVEKKEKIKKGKGSMAKILNKCSTPLGSLIISLFSGSAIDVMTVTPFIAWFLPFAGPGVIAGIIFGCIKLYGSSAAMANFFDTVVLLVFVILMLPLFIIMIVGIALELAVMVIVAIYPTIAAFISVVFAGASLTSVIFTYAKNKNDSYNKSALTGASTVFSILAVIKAIKNLLVYILMLIIPVVAAIVCGIIFIPKLF